MGVFVLEDLQGTAEVVLFPESFSKNAELITEDRVVFVKGKVDKKRENPNIIADDIIPIEEAAEKLAARVQLKLDSKQITDKKITAIKTICSRYRGKSDVCVTIQTPKGKVYATADKSFSVNPQVDFCKEIKRLVGEENFRITK
jgi:DNA polymerase-3 subunit alpha